MYIGGGVYFQGAHMKNFNFCELTPFSGIPSHWACCHI